MKKIIKLGTRRSMLAMAQSRFIAKEIEKLYSNITVELVGIETQGDRIQDVPLQKVEGKDFFVAELDKALIEKKVDFCVHSMKDLSLQRPKEIVLACVPKRANPHDIVVFHKRVIEKLKNSEPIKVGSSSPRRIENVPKLLEVLLPQKTSKPKLEWIQIRGNVNTRLSRIHLDLNHEKSLDAVVLALAGLERLCIEESAKKELEQLFQNTKIMILPLTQNPTAPAQGVLAVECRREDDEIFKILRKLHDEKTFQCAIRERKVLEEYGGGCHQSFGVTNLAYEKLCMPCSIETSCLGELLIIKGKVQNGKVVDEIIWQKSDELKNMLSKFSFDEVFDGSKHMIQSKNIEVNETLNLNLNENDLCFFSHHKVLLNKKITSKTDYTFNIAAGFKTWKECAKEGVWVSLCSDFFGFSDVLSLLESSFLNFYLKKIQKMHIFTNEDALDSWKEFKKQSPFELEIYNAYKSHKDELLEWSNFNQENLKNIKFAFFASVGQFKVLKDKLKNPEMIIATLPGKTYEAVKSSLKNVYALPSLSVWRSIYDKVFSANSKTN